MRYEFGEGKGRGKKWNRVRVTMMDGRERERERDTYVLMVHFSQGVITIPPRQAL